MAFESLTDRLAGVFKKLRGHGKLTEADIKAAMREVRMALPEADAAGIQHIRSRILCELLNAPGQVEQLGEE